MKNLLQLGADVNAPDPAGETPLCISCRFRSVKIFDALLEHGADVNLDDPRSPLIVCSQVGFTEAARVLLQKFPISPQHAHAAILSAIRYDHTGVVKLLIEHGVDLNNNQLGEPPILEAARHASMASFDLLLGCNADIRVVNKVDENLLDIALAFGNERVLDICIASDFDLNPPFTRNRKYSPGMRAVVKQDDASLRILRKLVFNGANIHHKTHNGHDMFTIAVSFVNTKAISVMIELGADVNTPIINGNTAMNFVCNHLNPTREIRDLARLLILNGGLLGENVELTSAGTVNNFIKYHQEVLDLQDKAISGVEAQSADIQTNMERCMEALNKVTYTDNTSVFPAGMHLCSTDEAVQMVTGHPVVIGWHVVNQM